MARPAYILTVCTGNICRSPMASALLQHALRAEAEPLRSMKVLSAGVAAACGEPPSGNAVLALRKVGLETQGHVSQPLTQELADGALAVFCMTEAHRAMIQLQCNPAPANLHLFRDFMPGRVEREISDPYGGSLGVYERCRDEMVEAIPSVLAYLRELTGEAPAKA